MAQGRRAGGHRTHVWIPPSAAAATVTATMSEGSFGECCGAAAHDARAARLHELLRRRAEHRAAAFAAAVAVALVAAARAAKVVTEACHAAAAARGARCARGAGRGDCARDGSGEGGAAP